MKKIVMPRSNNFCPQTLFLYGTYREDGTPNFGLFCWVSYCWDDGLGVMACIGGEKLTRDRIRSTGVFSANLVTDALLPLADRLGNTEGYNEEKRRIAVATTRGERINAPLLDDSPWSYELSVKQTIPLDGGEVYLCKIENVMGDEELADESVSLQERIHRINPVCTTHSTYFDFMGARKGDWGDFTK